MKASKVFPGAESNLKALLARLVTSEDKLVAAFTQLLPKFIFPGKEENAFEISQVSFELFDHLSLFEKSNLKKNLSLKLCQVTLAEIQYRLRNNEQDFTNILELTACVVVCSVTLITSKNNNDQSTAIIAFCCSLFSHVLSKFQELFNLNPGSVDQQNNSQLLGEGNQPAEAASKEIDNESSDEEEEETKRAKLRRRKVGSGSSDQEFSEEELFLDTNSEQESEEDEEALSDSGFHSAEAKLEPLLEIPPGAAFYLPVFKLLTDWFRANVQVVQVSSPTMRNMWITFADILNVFKRCQREDTDQFQSLPLEEDWKLYGLCTMTSIHSHLDFETSPLIPSNTLILNSIRIERIILFGSWLAQQESNNGFQLENGIYRCLGKEVNDSKTDGVGDKSDLMMRNMAHLWLKSEVQELERRLSPQPKRKKKTSFDFSNLSYVYLVPDVSALSEYTHLIKQVIKSQKLIVVVPDMVISELDQLKVNLITSVYCFLYLKPSF